MTYKDKGSYESSPPCTQETRILRKEAKIPIKEIYITPGQRHVECPAPYNWVGLFCSARKETDMTTQEIYMTRKETYITRKEAYTTTKDTPSNTNRVTET